MKLISGSSNPAFAHHLAQELGIEELSAELSSFANGEKRIFIQGDATGEDIILVQSFSQPVDSNIIEFLLLADSLERMGAKSIYAVIPWLGYSLQDKSFRTGEPIAAKVIANSISNSFIHRVYLLDLHNSSIPGFFSVPTIHVTANELFCAYTKKTFDMSRLVVASPDFGGLKRARTFANMLQVPLVNIDKHRDLVSGEVTAVEVHGEVEGKVVALFDDMILSGGTALETAKLLKDQGATQTHFLATHGLFVDAAVAKLNESQLDSVIVTDSVANSNLPDSCVRLKSASVFAQVLKKWV